MAIHDTKILRGISSHPMIPAFNYCTFVEVLDPNSYGPTGWDTAGEDEQSQSGPNGSREKAPLGTCFTWDLTESSKDHAKRRETFLSLGLFKYRLN